MSLVYTLLDGNEWNLLRSFPRNWLCPCGSKIKFKKCCYLMMPITISKREHAKWLPIIEQARKILLEYGKDSVFANREARTHGVKS